MLEKLETKLSKKSKEIASEINSTIDSSHSTDTINEQEENDEINFKNQEENLSQREKDQIKKEFKDQIDPYHSSNIFSKLFFQWVFKFIRLSNRIRINEEHFGKLSEDHQSINFSTKLKEYWDKSSYKNQENGVFKAMVAFNFKELIYCLFLWLVLSLIEFFTVNLFKNFIHTFESNTPENIQKSIIFAIMFFLVNFFNEIYARYIGFYMNDVCLRTKFQLQGLAYHKLLKISPSTRSNKMSDGKIINIIIDDTDKFKVLVHRVNDLIFSPLKIIGYSLMLVYYFGFPAVYGIIVIMICVILNYFIFHWHLRVVKERKKKKDVRIEYSNETLSNIKILKLYAWENKYYNKIKIEREEELQLIKNSSFINSLNIGNLGLMPILISSVILGVYQMKENNMKMEKVMTGMFIFNILKNSFKNIPACLEKAANAIVSFRRIQGFLNLEEINKSNIQKNQIELSFDPNDINNNNNPNDASLDSLNLNIHENSYLNICSSGDYCMKNKSNIFNTIDDENFVIKIPNLSFSWEISENTTEANKQVIKEDIRNELNEKDDQSDKVSNESEKKSEIIDYPIEENLNTILKNINLKVKKGEFIGIFGKIGSGKSSLIQAILNNMLIVNHNLPKDSKYYSEEKIVVDNSISYTSQISWIENATLKDNILFYNEFNEEKYLNVLNLCELNPDLKQLPAGDLTEIGEKGVNLSGGQKARVSLARAVYSGKEIILLDDPLSALDAETSTKIMKNLFCDYLKGKTRILVTHAIYFLENFDQIYYLDNGRINWSGTPELFKKTSFYKKMNHSNLKKQKENEASRKNSIKDQINEICPELDSNEHQILIQKNGEYVLNSHPNDSEISNISEMSVLITINSMQNKEKSDQLKNKIHKIISEEERTIGRVKLKVYLNYAKRMGGYIITLIIFFLQIGSEILKVYSDKWLVYWTKTNSEDTKWANLRIYFLLGFVSIILSYISVRIQDYRSIYCSRSLHQSMISRLIRAPINLFHETVPVGRIMNRLTNDLECVDIDLPKRLIQTLTLISSLIGVFIICGISFPISFLLLPLLLFSEYLVSLFASESIREMNRLLQISSSPISNMTLETVSGSTIVRAFESENPFTKKFHRYLDNYYKIYLFSAAVSAWFHLIIGMISSLLLAMFLFFSIYFREKFDQGTVALMLSYSMLFYLNVFQTLFSMKNLEIDLIKMERCLSITKLPMEKKYIMKNDKDLFDRSEEITEDTLNCNYDLSWPIDGVIEFRNYSVRYRPDTNIVLKNLNFKIQSGEKVGVIGRTGSGKSTLLLALFRILEPETGTIFIDGVDITGIGLGTLRSSMTIIPQDPKLMRGTLRYNIDPFDIYSDEKVIEILENLKINYLLKNSSGLDFLISEGGTNLSVGEKQLICIARALLKNSKIVVIDEATANIDIQTEEIIQNAMNIVLSSATVITIAHRIKTILNYNKILVLSNGKIKEFDSPKNLLKDNTSFFSKLVKKSKISIDNSRDLIE